MSIQSKSEKELKEARRRLHEVVWPMLSSVGADSSYAWQLRGGNDRSKTGLVYRGQHKKIGTIWKVECELPLSVQRFQDIFIDKLKPNEWAPHLAEYRVIEEARDGSWEITYSLSSGILGVDDRDFINLRFRDFFDNGTIYELTESTTHATVPKRPKCIRGEYLPSGCLIQPVPTDTNRCQVIWVNNLDMKGFLPKKVIRLVTTTCLLDFAKAIIAKSKEFNGQSTTSKEH